MMDDDDEDEFVLDAVGNRGLIGLSLEETIELELLRFSLPLRSPEESSRLRIRVHGKKGIR